MFTSERCFIIAEVAQAHDGSLGAAHAYIDAAAKAGADAVKFQTHFAEDESSADEPFRVRFNTQDATRYGYWKRLEFTEAQWAELASHAQERKIVFLSSPFSLRALKLLNDLSMPAWKVASGEITNAPLLREMARTGKPILLSTGMSPLEEVDGVVSMFQQSGNPVVLLQCTSSYPCPPENIGLNLIEFYRDRYRTLVGLSDHSGTIFPGLAAVQMGISALEVHVIFSRDMFGPDVPASLTFEELRVLVDGTRFIERMRGNPVDKDAVVRQLHPMREIFMKSLAAKRDMPAGTVIGASDIKIVKPAKGIPAAQFDEVLGRVLARKVAAGDFLQHEDFE